MSGQPRPATAGKRNPMKPPLMRPSSQRAFSFAPVLSGRASPAESTTSSGTILSKSRSPTRQTTSKRKDRDFETEGGEETNINVVVRCRGRNEREVRENSGVVVSTDGVKGKTVDLLMGPSALSNKTYHFDRVFSAAADQSMLFDEVVVPVMDEVLAGFNCTIFAYGQTGTGKTYTMSGDISEATQIPDDAGIIPRVLYSLFTKLEAAEVESTVKCSFIELYNEELRDLLAVDDSVRLKIFDDASRKSQSATLVQGMEETHIKSASKGIELLRMGSHKRQVAATKCNDLSSRSHTVFTVTVLTKSTTKGCEDFISAGKLNLVDLAGSENIQRSGAENKRATEAGLINKSLLTLGRVINALVDKSSHIPYRESKLTRLLQDSLGGHTKTCIIATLSPAKSNLEETISTLDYAFRAKNIRNKPQMNQLVSKKTLIREYTQEIEKLKSELIATRQRNGVYLTAESYEEMTTESESRRLLSDEQRDKIETLELNLKKKYQELISMTNGLELLKQDNAAVKLVLDGKISVLEETEMILAQVRLNLREETTLRKAHQQTEEELINIGQDLVGTLEKTTSEIGGLRSKIRRKSDLQTLNRNNWSNSQSQVADTTLLVEARITEFENRHRDLITALSSRLQDYVASEMSKLTESKAFLGQQAQAFEECEKEISSQTSKARDDMNNVLEGIKSLREDTKMKVGNGLQGLSAAAQRISAGVVEELDAFHAQLHTSYKSIGKDFRVTFDDILKHISEQQANADNLRKELLEAKDALRKATETNSAQLETVLAEERARSSEDRANLLSQMTSLVQNFGEIQDKRLETKIIAVKADVEESNLRFEHEHEKYQKSMDTWSKHTTSLIEDIARSREDVKKKIKNDWEIANHHNATIQTTTRAIHEETVSIVDGQTKNMEVQLQALDEIVAQVRAQNTRHHDSHVVSLQDLNSSVKESYDSIGRHFADACDRSDAFVQAASALTDRAIAELEPLRPDMLIPLGELRSDILSVPISEYMSTGETPQKINHSYQTILPRTADHTAIISSLQIGEINQSQSASPEIAKLSRSNSSPSKTKVFTDEEIATGPNSSDLSPLSRRTESRPASSTSDNASSTRLREINVNIVAPATTNMPMALEPCGIEVSGEKIQPPPKRQNIGLDTKNSTAGVGSKLPKKAVVAEGRENIPFSASVGIGTGRILRSRGS